VEKLHELILAKSTGTPKQLSKHLGINRTNLYMMMDELCSLNLSIGYSRKFQTYYYKTPEKLCIFSHEVTMNSTPALLKCVKKSTNE